MKQSVESVPDANARLLQIREALGFNQEAFASLLGISRPYLSNIEKGRNGVPFESVTFLIETKKVSAHWFHTGQGDMFTTPAAPSGQVNGQVNGQVSGKDKINHVSKQAADTQTKFTPATRSDILVATQDVDGNLTVPIVNRRAAANYLAGYQTQEYFEELDAMTVPSYMLRDGQGIVIQAVNDSMEDTIFEGDLLLCRLVEPMRWDDIADFTVCVLVSESRGIQVKRIKSRLAKEGLVRCKSDNRRYQAFNLFAEDILQVWQVSMLLTAQLPNRSDTLYRKVDSIEDTNTDMREVLEQLQERLYRLEHPGKTH